tara:strand:- start:14 stop:526 length:513 start_codon:yes stop_codon:yes gene_type:complete
MLKTATLSGFKRATGYGVRVGGSAERDNISEYSYINTKRMAADRLLRTAVKEVTKRLGLSDNVLTYNILHLSDGDFLDWQDYYMWNSKTQVSITSAVRGPVINFFSISLTDDNMIEFREDPEELINVPKHHGILFHPSDVHRVPTVSKDHTWLILGIPSHIDVGEVIRQD